jgi:RNA-directed DNA polymerase
MVLVRIQIATVLPILTVSIIGYFRNSVTWLSIDTPTYRNIGFLVNTGYEGDWIYWGTRMGQHPETNERVAMLLQKPKGKCTECGLYFREKDTLEIDHIIPVSRKGRDKSQNLQLLHRHCHDTKTAKDSTRYA